MRPGSSGFNARGGNFRAYPPECSSTPILKKCPMSVRPDAARFAAKTLLFLNEGGMRAAPMCLDLTAGDGAQLDQMRGGLQSEPSRTLYNAICGAFVFPA